MQRKGAAAGDHTVSIKDSHWLDTVRFEVFMISSVFICAVHVFCTPSASMSKF